MTEIGRTRPFITLPAMLIDWPVLPRAVIEPQSALALLPRLAADYTRVRRITHRELADLDQNPRYC